MATQLIPLNPEQHTITFVPKLAAELPFFNLTNYKKNLQATIKFEGTDNAGHPLRWEVYQNASEEIGAPGVEAHRIWYMLVKPAIDEERHAKGSMPEIIPLGKVRECLRKVGWTAGGRQERELIKCLTQISFAGCIADLWIPIKETDEHGKQKFVQVKGRFSRMSVYAIGEHHFTEEELKAIKFDFDPEDILYIKLDPLEARLQEALDQRVYDNEYWFSVDAAARRWYELLAPKIFGTIKNRASFCEVRYSWYTEHHHTLKRYHEHKRVKFQMNRIVQNHLTNGYISKVEYRKVVEPDKELDFIIRYYPGEAAKESIARIQGHIYRRRKTLKQPLEDEKLPEPTKASAGQGSGHTEANNATPSLFTEQHEQLAQQLITEFSVTPIRAIELVNNHTESVIEQLAAYSHRNISPKNKAGWIIEAVERRYQLPDEYLIAKQKEADRERTIEEHKQIVACSLCKDSNGWHRVFSDQYPTGAMRKCSHDETIEKQFRTEQ